MFLPYFFKVLHFGNYNCRSVGIIADADQLIFRSQQEPPYALYPPPPFWGG